MTILPRAAAAFDSGAFARNGCAITTAPSNCRTAVGFWLDPTLLKFIDRGDDEVAGAPDAAANGIAGAGVPMLPPAACERAGDAVAAPTDATDPTLLKFIDRGDDEVAGVPDAAANGIAGAGVSMLPPAACERAGDAVAASKDVTAALSAVVR